MRKIALGIALCLFGSVAALAADLSGTWKITASTPRGPIEMTMNLAQNGSDLTGTVTGPRGATMPVEEGSINGEKFRLKATGNGQERGFEISGPVGEDNLKVKIKARRGSVNGIATRVPAAQE